MKAIENDDLKYADRVLSQASKAMQDIFGSSRKIYDDNIIFVKDRDINKKSETRDNDINDDINDDSDELGVKVCPIPRKNQ